MSRNCPSNWSSCRSTLVLPADADLFRYLSSPRPHAGDAGPARGVR